MTFLAQNNIYLTQAAWFIDPSLGSDGYTGSSQTFTSGNTGPIKTYAELVRRWGTRSPVLRQNTVITFVSNQSGNSDPVIFNPIIENGALVQLTGVLQVVVSGNISNDGNFKPKNRTTGQLMNATFPAGVAANQLVKNTTHQSSTWTYKQVSGNTYSISEPLLISIPITVLVPTEVDSSWTTTDAVTLYNTVQVNLVQVKPIIADYNSPTFNVPLVVSNITVYDPNGVSDDNCYVGRHVSFIDCLFQRIYYADMPFGDDFQQPYSNVNFQGSIVSGQGENSNPINLCGGIIKQASYLNFPVFGFNYYTDIIISTNYSVAGPILNTVYIETSATLTTMSGGYTAIAGGGNGVLWGPGSLNVFHTNLAYSNGGSAQTAASTFLLSGGITINGLSTAYSINNTTLNSNISITAANLDLPASSSGFGGTAFHFNGSSITNNSTTQVAALTQTTWFVDRVSGSDTYNGLSQTFTSGTNGPLKTKNEIIRRWGTSSPVLNGITVTITQINSDTDNSDPFFASPFLINGSTLIIQGQLVAANKTFTGSLLSVTPKSLTGNQALQSTFTTTTGAITAGMLLVNTTQSPTGSRAMVQRLFSASPNKWQLCQPLTPFVVTAFPNPTNVDWVNTGDHIDGYTLTSINIIGLGGKLSTYDAGFSPGVICQQCTIYDPAANSNPINIDANPATFFADCNFQRVPEVEGGSSGLFGGFQNCLGNGIGSLALNVQIYGGGNWGFSQCQGGINFSNSAIITNQVALDGPYNNLYEMYVDNGAEIVCIGNTNIGSGHGVYGPGFMNIQGTTYYVGLAATAFPIANGSGGGLQINGLTKAYSINNTTLNSNISITAANLDAPASSTGFGGTAFVPGMGSITNGTGTQTSALTQAAWFIDPVSGYDGYTGLNGTFTSGTTGPLKTWAEVIRRYGTYSPRIRQATTFTFMSSHNDNSDPVYFSPFIENRIQVTIQGNLGASQQFATGTLAGTTPKNRATPQLLNANFGSGAAISAGQLVHNVHPLTGTYNVQNGNASVTASLSQTGIISAGSTVSFGSQSGIIYNVLSINGAGTTITLTAPYNGTTNAATTGNVVSRAWTYKQVSGNNYAMSQPLNISNITNSVNVAEADVWTSGDGYTIYNPVQVNIVNLQPIVADYNSAFLSNLLVSDLVVYDPSGTTNDVITINSFTTIQECSIQRDLQILPQTNGDAGQFLFNCDFAGGIVGSVATADLTNIYGGQFRSSAFAWFVDNIAYYCDFILGKNAFVNGTALLGTLYLDTGVTYTMQSGLLNCTGTYPVGPIIWGPGIINTTNNSTVSYTAGTATTTFINNGGSGLRLNGQTKAYSINNTTLNSNIAITGANLDAPAGPAGFGGTAFIPGSGSITGGGAGTQTSALTQATWFIDPINGFDGYTGLVSAFTSGTTGPVKTWAELVRRWGTNAPFLAQNTSITFVNSQSGNTDPVIFNPYIINGAVITLTGTLGVAQQFSTGTIPAAGVTSKVRSPAQLLKVNFGSGTALSSNKLVKNTTHTSSAWTYTQVTGNTFNISQPLNGTAEVDTWAAADGYTIYTPVNVNIVQLKPVVVDYDGGFDVPLQVSSLTVYDPGGVETANCYVGLNVSFTDVLFQRIYFGDMPVDNILSVAYSNVNFTAGMVAGQSFSSDTVALNGGLLTTGNLGADVSGLNLLNDIIIYGAGGLAINNCVMKTTYIETGTSIQVISGGFSGSAATGAAIWGGGSINVQNSTFVYGATGAETAVNTFLLTGGITINLSTTASAYNPTGIGTFNSGITITAANLDAAISAGGFGGTALIPGGGTITNLVNQTPYSTLAFLNSLSAPIITQTALASTSGGNGAAGQLITISAQPGQPATGGTNNGGAGGNITLASGAGGSSGGGTAGAGGLITLSLPTTGSASTGANYIDLQYNGADFLHIGYGINGAANQATFYLPASSGGSNTGITFQASASNSQFVHFISAPTGGLVLFDSPTTSFRSAGGTDFIDFTPALAALMQFNVNATTSATINQANTATNGATGVTLTIQAQNATGTTTTGGNLALTPGTGTTKGGLIVHTGGQSVQQISVSASTYTVDTTGSNRNSDYVIFTDSTSNTINITLPTPTAGRMLIIKDKTGQAATHNVTITHSASETIDGATTYVLSSNYASATLCSDGTNWAIL